MDGLADNLTALLERAEKVLYPKIGSPGALSAGEEFCVTALIDCAAYYGVVQPFFLAGVSHRRVVSFITASIRALKARAAAGAEAQREPPEAQLGMLYRNLGLALEVADAHAEVCSPLSSSPVYALVSFDVHFCFSTGSIVSPRGVVPLH